jgi:hypothetical protein
MQMGIPLETAFQMEMVTESERATSGVMMMADNIPRAVSSSISGGMMSGNDFYTPFLITTWRILRRVRCFTFFRKAKTELTASSRIV